MVSAPLTLCRNEFPPHTGNNGKRDIPVNRFPNQSKQQVALAASLFVISLLSGCTYSVHPLLNEKDFTDELDLSGTWDMERSDKDGKKQTTTRLVLEKYEKSTYDVTQVKDKTTKKNTSPYDLVKADLWTLNLGKIKDQHYVQLIPAEGPPGPPLYGGVPVYCFGRVEIKRDEIKFYGLLDRACAELAEKKKLRHIKQHPSDQVELTIFTMSTDELQEMVEKHGKTIFSPQPWIFKRVASEEKQEH